MAVIQQDLARPTRWPVLDGFRGVAILTVVAYHAVKIVLESQDLVHPEPTAMWLWPLGLGRLSVDAFFVLSGFLIVTTWDRRPELGHFFRRRIRRLWPAYLVSVLVLVPLLAPDLLWSWGQLAYLVGMQGYLQDGLTSRINVPWWSLTTEVQFYLLVPLLAPLLHRRFLRWGLLGGAVLLSAWWWGRGAEEAELAGSLLPGRLSQFVLGALVGIAIREKGAGLLLRSRSIAVACGVGLVALGLYLGHNGTYHRREGDLDVWIEPLSGLALALLLGHLVLRGDVLTGRPLRAAGLVSYSAYLWHYPILLFAAHLFDVEEMPALALVAMPLAVAATAAVTWLSYRFVERPVLYRSGRRTMPEVGTPVPAVTSTFSTSST